jgi:hypothetical protein
MRPVMVLGGFIATAPQWEAFVPEWQAMLDAPPRISYFKMSEAGRLETIQPSAMTKMSFRFRPLI